MTFISTLFWRIVSDNVISCPWAIFYPREHPSDDSCPKLVKISCVIQSGDLKNPQFDTKIIKIGPEMAEICQREVIFNFESNKFSAAARKTEVSKVSKVSIEKSRCFETSPSLESLESLESRYDP